MTSHYNPFISAFICLTNSQARHFYALQLAHCLVAFSATCLFVFNLGVTTSEAWNRYRIPKLPPAHQQRLLPPAKFESAPIEDPWTAPLPPEPEKFTTLPRTPAPVLMLPGTCDLKLSDLRRRYKILTGHSLPRNCTKAEALRIIFATT